MTLHIPKQITKHIPKKDLSDALKAIQSPTVNITFIEGDDTIYLTGKRNTATLRAFNK